MSQDYLNSGGYDSYSFWGDIDEHVTRIKPVSKHSKNFYPSEASVVLTDEYGDRKVEGACLRKAFYRIKAFQPAPPRVYSEYIFQQGRDCEKAIINWAKERGRWVDNSHKFSTSELGFPIKGELDGIFIEPHTGNLYIMEAKTFYGYYATKEIMGNYKQKGFPKMSHLLQLLLYVYLFRPNSGFNFTDYEIPYGRLVYWARDNAANRKTFKVELKQEGEIFFPVVEGEVVRTFTVNDMIARYRKLKEHLDNDEVPPRDFEHQYSPEKIRDFFEKGKVSKKAFGDWQKRKKVPGDPLCSPTYCPYFHHCYERANL